MASAIFLSFPIVTVACLSEPSKAFATRTGDMQIAQIRLPVLTQFKISFFAFSLILQFGQSIAKVHKFFATQKHPGIYNQSNSEASI
jgi:hypothetical protein